MDYIQAIPALASLSLVPIYFLFRSINMRLSDFGKLLHDHESRISHIEGVHSATQTGD